MKSVLGGMIALSLSACTAKFGDVHHFATVDPVTQQVDNIFRVRLKGHAEMTNVRYLAGYYDERAVDLFFNEYKAGDLTPGKGVGSIFSSPDCTGLDAVACKARRDARLETIPIGKDAGEQGTFVMILSTDADSVANTIGALAESDLATQAALFLATKDSREDGARVAASATSLRTGRKSTMSSIRGLMALNPSTDDAATQRALAVLRAAAAGIAPDGGIPAFTTVDEARLWFAAQPRGNGR